MAPRAMMLFGWTHIQLEMMSQPEMLIKFKELKFLISVVGIY